MLHERESRPKMNHITDNIWIGDADEAQKRNRLELKNIVYVVTLNGDRHTYTTVHAPIEDGKNEQEDFDHAVAVVNEAFNQEGETLVHCKSGMSRSVTCVATALAEREGWTLSESLEFVGERREVANPHPDLVEHAEVYLEDRR